MRGRPGARPGSSGDSDSVDYLLHYVQSTEQRVIHYGSLSPDPAQIGQQPIATDHFRKIIVADLLYLV